MTKATGVWAITICQPWAYVIMAGYKRYENRSWPTKYRGELLIHAGKNKRHWTSGCKYLESLGIKVPAESELDWGAIVAAVNVTGCIRPSEANGDPFASGPWCHVYELLGPLVMPVECPGKLSLWTVPQFAVDSVQIRMDPAKSPCMVPRKR